MLYNGEQTFLSPLFLGPTRGSSLPPSPLVEMCRLFMFTGQDEAVEENGLNKFQLKKIHIISVEITLRVQFEVVKQMCVGNTITSRKTPRWKWQLTTEECL